MKNLEVYAVIVITILLGWLAGWTLSMAKLDFDEKSYPIEVVCYHTGNGTQHYSSMEADSVKGDTIYKDGLYIINNNISNVSFK